MDRIRGNEPSNREKRQIEKQKEIDEENRWTVDKLWTSYKKNHPDLKGIKTYKSTYSRHIKPDFGDKEPYEIYPLDIRRVQNRMLKTLSAQSVQHNLELLRRLINYGVTNQLCKPLGFKIQMPRVDNQKTEDLDPEQLKKLLATIEADKHPQAGPMMKMALFTGMRRGELFRLKWAHIDFERGFIHIKDPKGFYDQKIPLNSAARDLLESHPKIGSPYVFPGKDGGQRVNIAKQVNKIKKDAGLPADFRPLHGLRHVYASMLASSGQVDMYTLQKLVTHKDATMTQRYAHLHDESLKRASDLAGELITCATTFKDEKETPKRRPYEDRGHLFDLSEQSHLRGSGQPGQNH